MPYDSGSHSMIGWGEGWHWFAGLHGVVWIVVLVALLVAIGVLVRCLRRAWASAGDTPARTPLAVLEERYARGEIDREEFLQKKKDLA